MAFEPSKEALWVVAEDRECLWPAIWITILSFGLFSIKGSMPACGRQVRYKLREDEGEIQFRKALGSLGIGMIYTGKRQALYLIWCRAGSGQGKGRKDV